MLLDRPVSISRVRRRDVQGLHARFLRVDFLEYTRLGAHRQGVPQARFGTNAALAAADSSSPY